MAFIVPRKGYKGVYVYYHDPNTGRQQQIKRKETKHLDKLSLQERLAWIEQWESKNGIAKARSERVNLSENDHLLVLWNAYQRQRTKTHKRRHSAESNENAYFLNHIVPFFVGKHERKKPETWHDLVPSFHSHLFDQELSDQTIRYILWTLERFGNHLVWARQMSFPFAIQTPSRENVKITPLKVRLTPDEILKFCKIKQDMPHEADVKLSILLGYFAGLRPSEQWALDKSDFLTGKLAEEKTRTLIGLKEKGLGTKLSIMVTKTWQRRKSQPPAIEELTKSHYSRSVVNVWNPEAAKMIGSFLKDKKDGRIFSLGYYGWFQLWRREVEPRIKATSHDLRRASGLYLGRTKRLSLTLLQEHLRHSEMETTMLYTREPEVPEMKQKVYYQDFSDVV